MFQSLFNSWHWWCLTWPDQIWTAWPCLTVLTTSAEAHWSRFSHKDSVSFLTAHSVISSSTDINTDWSVTKRKTCFVPFFSLASSTSTSNLSLHPPSLWQLLFLTTGHYELLALAPGNYGNGFLLDRWWPVGRLHHNNQVCVHARARTGAHAHSAESIFALSFTHLVHYLPQALAHTSSHKTQQTSSPVLFLIIHSTCLLAHTIIPFIGLFRQYKWVQCNVIQRWIKAQCIYLAAISGVNDSQPQQLLVAMKDRISCLLGNVPAA